MSVVTFAQETLAVLTELTDEEINGVVGGALKAGIKSETEGKYVQSSNTIANTTAYGAKNGDVYASTSVTTNQNQDFSKNSAVIGSFNGKKR